MFHMQHSATAARTHDLKCRITAHNLPDDYGHLDPNVVVVASVICILAVLRIEGSSRFNYVASIVHVITILFIIITGFTKADTKNYSPFPPYNSRGIFVASTVVFFAYVGFDAISTMAEESKNPTRDIPIGLVGSMTVIALAYCLLAAVLCLMVPYRHIDPDAAFSVVFEYVGTSWAKYIAALGALQGMTTAMPVKATGTPVNATVLMIIATAIVAFFTKMDILTNLLSISTLFIFVLVAVALLVRRYYVTGVTTPANHAKLAVCLALIGEGNRRGK
ncbi:cationic amino acid transporter, putative [Ricinus communis]|uniref:Cationic amino acid transporter, putative n=1 Tax=Ricinus communis TaxID=3988 RepID=B9S5Z6_RICCO|nr:cationic amino acid transporter, putative [Ricinus communis]